MNFINITDKFQPYALILLVINNVYTLCGLTRQIPRCKGINKINKAYSVRFKVRSIILLVPILLEVQEGKKYRDEYFFTPINHKNLVFMRLITNILPQILHRWHTESGSNDDTIIRLF